MHFVKKEHNILQSKPYSMACSDTVEILLWEKDAIHWTGVHYIPEGKILFRRSFDSSEPAEADYEQRGGS